MSVETLASELGVHRTTIYRWESRERDIDRKLWADISQKTGIPVAVVAGLTAEGAIP